MNSIFREPALPRFTTLLRAVSAAARTAEQSAVRKRQADAERESLVRSLKARAETAGWSQRELARRLGIPVASWHRLCTGQRAPLEWLPRLRRAAEQ